MNAATARATRHATDPIGLAGASCLVIGGSSGIGEATAATFAAAGAEVVVCGRDADKADRAAARIGDRATAVRADATSTADLDRLFEQTGEVDHLVVSAGGTAGAGPFAELDLRTLRDAFEAKVWGQLQTLQAALGRISSSITLITAGSSRGAMPGTVGLAAINGALDAVVRPLAAELAPVRVNAVAPGVIRTPWWEGTPAEQREATFEAIAAAVPAGRVGEAAEVARAVMLVAANGYITGSILDCAGGLQLATGP